MGLEELMESSRSLIFWSGWKYFISDEAMNEPFFSFPEEFKVVIVLFLKCLGFFFPKLGTAAIGSKFIEVHMLYGDGQNELILFLFQTLSVSFVQHMPSC